MEGRTQRPAARTSSRLFENYEIQRLLGTGTFGAVFDCMNKFERKNYAIKVMKFDRIDAEREIGNLVKIPHHPNLVQYFTCFKDSFGVEDVEAIRKQFGDEDFGHNNFIIPSGLLNFDAICILMELCGEDLREWLSTHETVDVSMSVNIFTQITKGLEHLHRNGLIHRDLKPENIFLSRLNSSNVKIGDLGIATDTKRSNHTEGIGTRAYLAPEQEGNSYGTSVDIFALGIIFLELLHPPMQPDADEEENGKAGNHTKVVIGLKYLHTVPEEVYRLWPIAADLILKMVSIEPEDRPSFEEIHSTIERICQNLSQNESVVDIAVVDLPGVETNVQNVKPDSVITGASPSILTVPAGDQEEEEVECLQALSETCNIQINDRPGIVVLCVEQPFATKVRTAVSGQHLESLFQTSNPGDTVELLESTHYFGSFIISTKNLTLEGNGATIRGIEIALKIHADKCTIKNLNLQADIGMFVCGQGITIKSVAAFVHPPKDTSCGFILQGNYNSLKNCSVNGQQKGVLVTGNNNTFDTLKICNSSQKGVVLKGSNCSLTNIECLDCNNGIWVGGDHNTILDMIYQTSENYAMRYKFGQSSTGSVITIGQGENNVISGFKNLAKVGEYKTGLHASIYTSKLKIAESCLGKLYLDGNDHDVQNTTALQGVSVIGNKCILNNVNCGARLEIQGSSHQLTKCSTILFLSQRGCDVEIIECDFD